MKISATIITFNEEENIERCIKSLIPIAHEIIILDSYSTDRTLEICNQFNSVKVIQQEFKGYGHQKNDAINLANEEYILSLDGDEVISQNLQEEILQIMKDGKPTDAYKMPRLNQYYGRWIRHGGFYPDYKIRLWKKGIIKWDTALVHEKLILRENPYIQTLKGDILHYTTKNIHDHIHQINKFSELAANQLFLKGKKKKVKVKILLSPIFTFVKKFIFQLGFLDGFAGFFIAINSAHAKFLKYAKYHQLKKNQ